MNILDFLYKLKLKYNPIHTRLLTRILIYNLFVNYDCIVLFLFLLELGIVKKKLGKRHSFESLRSYFIVILTPQVDPRVVHQFCDLYEAARFNPKPFTEDDYKAFSLLVKQLRNA